MVTPSLLDEEKSIQIEAAVVVEEVEVTVEETPAPSLIYFLVVISLATVFVFVSKPPKKQNL